MSRAGAGKPLLTALAGRSSARPPFWLMRQAGRYLPEYRALRERAKDFLDFCYRPELAVEATLQPIRRYGMDAAILFSDILVIPDALGVAVRFESGEGPLLEPTPDAAAVARLSARDLETRLAPVYDAVSGVAAALDSRTALIGFAGAPWTIACYMVEGGGSRDFARVKRWAFSDAEGFGRLIDLLVEAVSRHLIAQAASGAEALQIFDSWAGALPATAFQKWCVEPVSRIVAAVKKAHPDVPVIGFPRGAGLLYRGYAQATGIDCVGLDGGVPTAWAAQELQPGAAVQGNLDPQMLVVGGAAMAEEARRIMRDLAGGGFVFNLGHGVVPETPPENVAALARLIRGEKP